MKIRILLMALLAFVSSISKAQLSAVDYNSEDFTKFKASKTYCVKTGNKVYDDAMAAAMAESWKITPFDFISTAELKTKIKDASASFISLITIDGDMGYHYLALFNGGRKSIDNYGYNDMIAYSPVNHWSDERELTDCGWRVKNMLESMVLGIEIVQKNDIHGNSLKIVNQLRDYYKKKAPQIKTRTLLIAETSMGMKFKKAEVPGVYPFKVEVCPRSKVEKAIADKSKDYYYLQPGLTKNKSIFVIDPSNGEVMYFEYSMQGMNISMDNIKDLAETIKGN